MVTDVFKSNDYSENFINNLFKVFLNNKYRIQEKVITVPQKTLLLVPPYLGWLPLQTRTKLKKSLKVIPNCCKLQIMFKSENKLAKAPRFKDRIPKELTSGVVYKFSVDSAMNTIMMNAYARIAEHIAIYHWLRRKLGLWVVLLAIIYYFVTILHLSKILIWQSRKIKNSYRNWKKVSQ